MASTQSLCVHSELYSMWPHLTELPSKIKTQKRSKWPIRENVHLQKFLAIRYVWYLGM